VCLCRSFLLGPFLHLVLNPSPSNKPFHLIHTHTHTHTHTHRPRLSVLILKSLYKRPISASTSKPNRMNIAAMLEPTQVAPYPILTSASSSPLQPSSQQQRLPSISHVTSALHQHQLQPLSSHNMQQHVQIMPQPQSSLPTPPRQALPPRVDSMSSINSSTQGSVEYTTHSHPSTSSKHPRQDSTVRRDSSASSSNINSHQRRRPGGQTKAACLPCRKRKSKVRSFFSLVTPQCYTCLICSSPPHYSFLHSSITRLSSYDI
jgi:hypothetical protein